MCLFVVALLVPSQAPAKKRTWQLGERTLKQGHKGNDVRAVQRYLARVGIDTGVDGIFGSATGKAVRTFEAAQRRSVDGQLTRSDATALKDVALNGGAVAAVAANGGAAPRSVKLALPTPEPPASPPALALGPGMVATVGSDGLAVAPAGAPPEVQAVIEAGNRIATTPYIYGGGHGRWEDEGYDCSGSVSYALHGAGLLDTPMASGGFMTWADPGPGQWITAYSHASHMYLVVAGLRFDTSGRSSTGTRWQADNRSASGYSVRHPPGF